MSARLALIGGEEFSPGFEDVHAELLANCGNPCRVAFLPTCAADDGADAVAYWSELAHEKLGALGAIVETPAVIDAVSANDAHYAQQVADADWIYFGGGYPHVAMRILSGSRVLRALWHAQDAGALVSGSSGGAMLMAARSWVMTPELAVEVGRYWDSGTPLDWDPPLPPMIDGLGLIPRSICAPHFNRVFSWRWVERGDLGDGHGTIGIDEQTALVNLRDAWEVRGRGSITIVRPGLEPERYGAGDRVKLEELLCWNCTPCLAKVETAMATSVHE